MKKLKAKIACLEARLKKEETYAETIRSLLSKATKKVELIFNREKYNNEGINDIYGNYIWIRSKISYTDIRLEYVPNRQSILLKVRKSKVASEPWSSYEGEYMSKRTGIKCYSKRIPLEDMDCLFDYLRKYHVKPSHVIAKIEGYGGKSK